MVNFFCTDSGLSQTKLCDMLVQLITHQDKSVNLLVQQSSIIKIIADFRKRKPYILQYADDTDMYDFICGETKTITQNITVNVAPKVLSSITVTTPPTKTTYIAG